MRHGFSTGQSGTGELGFGFFEQSLGRGPALIGGRRPGCSRGRACGELVGRALRTSVTRARRISMRRWMTVDDGELDRREPSSSSRAGQGAMGPSATDRCPACCPWTHESALHRHRRANADRAACGRLFRGRDRLCGSASEPARGGRRWVTGASVPGQEVPGRRMPGMGSRPAPGAGVSMALWRGAEALAAQAPAWWTCRDGALACAGGRHLDGWYGSGDGGGRSIVRGRDPGQSGVGRTDGRRCEPLGRCVPAPGDGWIGAWTAGRKPGRGRKQRCGRRSRRAVRPAPTPPAAEHRAGTRSARERPSPVGAGEAWRPTWRPRHRRRWQSVARARSRWCPPAWRRARSRSRVGPRDIRRREGRSRRTRCWQNADR